MAIFLGELAALMRKHGVSMEGVETTSAYYATFDTIEIDQQQDENIGRAGSTIRAGKYFDADDLESIRRQ